MFVQQATAAQLPSHIWLSFDWAQAELYMLTLFSKDTKLKEALQSSDVHRYVISMLYGIPMDQVTEEQRDLAKILSYALIYSGFDFDSTISNVLKKANTSKNRNNPLTREVVVEALTKYMSEFRALFEWTGAALNDWYHNAGLVSYFLGAKKTVPVPDYLKPDESAMRRNTSGRVAINTYGQNSVGLLLKFFLSGIQRNEFLRTHTAQRIPLFDAASMLVKSEHAAAALEIMHHLATPVLRHNGFEIRMQADWKASLSSWGELSKIASPDVSHLEPIVYQWDTEELAQVISIPELDSSFNPFASPIA